MAESNRSTLLSFPPGMSDYTRLTNLPELTPERKRMLRCAEEKKMRSIEGTLARYTSTERSSGSYSKATSSRVTDLCQTDTSTVIEENSSTKTLSAISSLFWMGTGRRGKSAVDRLKDEEICKKKGILKALICRVIVKVYEKNWQVKVFPPSSGQLVSIGEMNLLQLHPCLVSPLDICAIIKSGQSESYWDIQVKLGLVTIS